MSVDFFPCNICSESICDCGSYFHCTDCGSNLCDDCSEKYKCGSFADTEEFPVEDDEGNEIDYSDDFRNCPYCQLKLIHSETLLEFALTQLGTSRESLEDKYRKAFNFKGKQC